jgi:hypothetical protein
MRGVQQTSCPDFAASVPATRALIAAPGPRLAVFSVRGRRGGMFRADGGLTQKRAQRFHLNFVPRHSAISLALTFAFSSTLIASCIVTVRLRTSQPD